MTTLDREVEQRLRERELRYTRGRRAVVGVLAAAEGPRAAADLRHAGVPLSSLYRTLAVLERAGVVVPHFAAGGVTRYELAEWLTGHHHHLICVGCGAVEDVSIRRPFEARVRRLVDDIAADAAFTALDHALEIEGRCARCA